ncbi:NAD-dependent epimerase/dehydratase family protein [bacterium]|jgi:nucleoside-diphosphate-sugar epimerase|nr:NAD-dependent epimerase/dehydratase family protein [bacterium]
MSQKIFITGGSGCIGHHIVEDLLKNPELELHLLCRDQARFKVPGIQTHPNVTFHAGSMETIETLKPVLQEMDHLIHIATEWGDYEHTVHINVNKTLDMLNSLNSKKIQRIMYFSTASILGNSTSTTKAAETEGTPYVRSKYRAYQSICKHPLRDKVVSIFPTTVWGATKNYPKSHLSEGIPTGLNYVNVLKWFYFDAAFHLMHAKDISKVCIGAMLTDDTSLFKQFAKTPNLHQGIVVGQPVITERQAVKVFCQVLRKKQWFQIKIPHWFIFLLLKIFRIQLAPWDRYCINNPFFSYTCIRPEDLRLTSSYPNLESVVKEALVASETPTTK